MKSCLKFWFSKNRNTYIAIARKYNTTPWHVYDLAHIGRTRNLKDYQIIDVLIRLNIVRRMKTE